MDVPDKIFANFNKAMELQLEIFVTMKPRFSWDSESNVIRVEHRGCPWYFDHDGPIQWLALQNEVVEHLSTHL